jgi:hypothetical protein
MGELKHRGHYNTTVPKEQIELMRKLAANTGRPISRLTEEALNDFFIKYGIKNNQPKK